MRLQNEKPEVYHNGQWRPICGHYFWNNNNGADLFCQKLDRRYRSGNIIAGYLGGFGMYPLPSDGLKIGECKNNDNWLTCSGGCNDMNVGGQCRFGGNCGSGSNAGIKIRCSCKTKLNRSSQFLSISTFRCLYTLVFLKID